MFNYGKTDENIAISGFLWSFVGVLVCLGPVLARISGILVAVGYVKRKV